MICLAKLSCCFVGGSNPWIERCLSSSSKQNCRPQHKVGNTDSGEKKVKEVKNRAREGTKWSQPSDLCPPRKLHLELGTLGEEVN